MPNSRQLKLDPQPAALRGRLEDLVPVRVVRIAEVIARLATATIQVRVGLRNTDLRLLNLLDGTDGATVNELGRLAHIDKGWVSRSLRQLERAGLVVRRRSREDSRHRKVVLSPKGAALLEKVRPMAMNRERCLLVGIEEARFKKDLDRLMRNADAMLVGQDRSDRRSAGVADAAAPSSAASRVRPAYTASDARGVRGRPRASARMPRRR